MSNKCNNNSGSVLASLLLGAAAGVALGLLYAPEEGKKTRKKIKEKADDLACQAKDQYAVAVENARKQYEKAKEQYEAVTEKAKEQYGNITSQVKETTDKVVSNVKDGYDKYKTQAADTVAQVSKDIETELDALK